MTTILLTPLIGGFLKRLPMRKNQLSLSEAFLCAFVVGLSLELILQFCVLDLEGLLLVQAGGEESHHCIVHSDTSVKSLLMSFAPI